MESQQADITKKYATSEHTYINKYHRKQALQITISKFAYVGKWESNEKINQKLSDHFWKAVGIHDL